MLGDDERPAQGDHHQNAQQRSEQTDQHHTRHLQIKAEDHDRRHGGTDAEGDRFSGRPRGLNDVIFQNRRVTTAPHFRPKPEQG